MFAIRNLEKMILDPYIGFLGQKIAGWIPDPDPQHSNKVPVPVRYRLILWVLVVMIMMERRSEAIVVLTIKVRFILTVFVVMIMEKGRGEVILRLALKVPYRYLLIYFICTLVMNRKERRGEGIDRFPMTVQSAA
jgi:hypothetical protein